MARRNYFDAVTERELFDLADEDLEPDDDDSDDDEDLDDEDDPDDDEDEDAFD